MGLKTIPVVLLALVLAGFALFAYGEGRWESATEKLLAAMRSTSKHSQPDTYYETVLQGLPAPVQRYFLTVLQNGQPIVTGARINHVGTFNMGESDVQWRPFKSQQNVVTTHPGFVWDARIRMAPGLNVFVHDAYVAGEGILSAKLFGIVTVMEQPRTPELAEGELMRFFAEAAWYPTALLPSEWMQWQEINDSQARGLFTDGSSTVSLVFTFDSDGLISSVRSDERFRQGKEGMTATPWEGRFWNYTMQEGMLVPSEGEVSWILPEGPLPYWRGRIEAISYVYAD